jgi:chromosome segregation ATPase
MKYLLDIVLLLGLLGLGWMWNGEKQAGLALSDEIDKLKANIARLELDVNAARETGAKAAEDLEAVRADIETASASLQETTAALEEKTKEADALKETGLRLKARVDELEGYKAKAIVAEMPKPPAP